MNMTFNEVECFGCPVESLRIATERAMTYWTATGFAASILSDAQEAIARGNNALANQLINRAKWVLTEYKEKN